MNLRFGRSFRFTTHLVMRSTKHFFLPFVRWRRSISNSHTHSLFLLWEFSEHSFLNSLVQFAYNSAVLEIVRAAFKHHRRFIFFILLRLSALLEGFFLQVGAALYWEFSPRKTSFRIWSAFSLESLVSLINLELFLLPFVVVPKRGWQLIPKYKGFLRVLYATNL